METNNCEWTNASTSEDFDRMEILAVIDIYVEALRLGRVDLLKKSFHESAIMYGFSAENKKSEGSIQVLYDIIEKHGPLRDVTSKNTVVHLTNNTALVVAELQNTSPNQNSTDHLSLMRIDGWWKIISKVYHLSNIN